MIFQQIKKYPEPTKVTQTGSYYSSRSSSRKTEAEILAWHLECEKARTLAQSFLSIGDTVLLNAPRAHTRVTIHGFLTDPEKIYPYQDKPCLIEAINPIYPQSGAERYALHELNLASISYKEQPNANPTV